MSFLVVSNLDTGMILGTACVDGFIEKSRLRKGPLKPTGSSLVAIGESISNASYIESNVKTKHEHHDGEYSRYPCTAAYQRVVPPKSKACLYVRSNFRGVQLVISHEKLLKTYKAFVVQGIVRVVPTKPFIIKMANQSNKPVRGLKKMKEGTFLEALTSWIKA